MKSVTIYDVARQAGVAPSTVSRAFKMPGRVNAETRERVLAVAEELGYRPGNQSGNQSDNQSGNRPGPGGADGNRTIAMLVSDITNPHYFELIRGAELRARAAGTTLVLVNCEESPQIELEQVHGLADSVGGFVLASSRLPDQDLRDVAAEHPVVLLSRELPGLSSVALDMGPGCRQILEHLSSLGHRSLTYCAGPPSSWMGAARWAALSSGAAEYDLEVHRVGPYTPTVANGSSAADAAVRTGTTAIVAHNDLLAIGIMRRLADRGVRVPDEVSVVGFDDTFAASLVQPSLTTLGGAVSDAGRRAVDLLVGRLGRALVPRSDGQERVSLPTELIVRASSGPAPH